MGIILLWAKYFGPKPPAQLPQASRPAETAPATPGPASSTAASVAAQPPAAGTKMPAAAPSTVVARSDSQERTIAIENDLYRVEISNRGAVVKSWQLKKYLDDAKPQRVLDVVHPDASQQTGGWPFSVLLDDTQLQNGVNQGLFQISSDSH